VLRVLIDLIELVLFVTTGIFHPYATTAMLNRPTIKQT